MEAYQSDDIVASLTGQTVAIHTVVEAVQTQNKILAQVNENLMLLLQEIKNLNLKK